ncbi:MAG TPA: VOC family protein [Acetobacteraceae bacterium]|jgi:lactoylglutathione lyase|nr:VOC family protein [Acetobacteraceae bacterium]
MGRFTYEHIHLRSPDPEATAQYYANMFDAEIIRSTQADGAPRIDLNLGGQKVFIARAQADKTNAAPKAPYFGLEHIGLTVTDIDGITAELKGKGADFTMEPNTVRPGVRIAFLRGPEGVLVELIQRG